MKIDDFDCTMVCDENDLQTVFSYFKDFRVVPEYIEIAIMQIILDKTIQKKYEFNSFNEYITMFPDRIINSIIKDINNMYDYKSKTEYANRHLSYLMYYLPANLFKIWKPLLDLQIKNLLKPHFSLLDIGSGPGSIPVGIIEYYKELAVSFPQISFSIKITLIEAEKEFIEISEEMISKVKGMKPHNLEICLEKSICISIDENTQFDSNYQYDLITMSNFLNVNEGENYKNSIAIISKIKNLLKQDGSFIIIEPGDKNSSKSLKRIRNELVNNQILNIFSPCIGIWEEKSKYNCECFSMVRCFWEIPRLYNFLRYKGLNKGNRIDVPFNYVVLRKDNLKKYETENNSQHYVKLNDIRKFHGQVVNVKALIRTVIEKDNNLIIALCDGTCEFAKDSEAVWFKISKEKLKKSKINNPLIAGGRMTLKKILVNISNQKVNLEAGENVIITIDY